MSKIANGNVVYSGWLVKSPPENKFRLSGPWKIFRSFSQDAMDTSKWKRRFFILFKPQGSLPHQYVLNYYNNEEGKKLKGYIDLEHCEQIIESLDLDLFPFLLAIKTYHKNRERTYFLAADTEEQMTSWVRNLCSVCGLKPEDNSSDLPPQREEDNDTFTTIQNVPSSITKQPITQPTQGITHVPQSRDRKNSDRDYVPLTNCRTGTVSRKPPLLRPDSVDSVPDEIAPPPPVKRGQVIEDDVFHTVYDMPPKAHDMNVTMPAPKICTSSESSSKDDSTLDVYDVPPPGHPPRHSPSTPRSSSSESHKADSAYSSQSVLTYDYPPSSEKNVVSDETYDYPPTNPHNLPKMDDVPPVRPPPPKSYLQQQEPYQNIPPNSKMLNEGIDSLDINKVVPMSTNLSANVPLSYDFPSNNASTQSAYDFPTSGQSGSSLLVIPPPGCGIDSHSYINAATRPVSHAHEDMYLAMDGLVPPAVADRTSSISDSGKSHDSYTLMSELNVYDHPPPQRPPRISKVIPKPCNGDAYTNIYKNERTRSFKKNNTINNPPFDFPSGRDPYAGKISRSLQHSIPLPKNNNPHPDLTTSSEDEEDDRIADIDQVMVPYPYEEHQKSQNWNKVPPPMKSDKDELKYLELDLVDQPTSQPIHLTHAETGNNTPTEYREIDFVKTTALREVKKTVEGQRKHDEN